MRLKRCLAAILAAAVSVSVIGCGNSGGQEKDTVSATEQNGEQAAADYEFGEGVTFHSEEPVTYSLLYSDHENYPNRDDWRIWSAISEMTNVSFDLSLVARTDYNDKVSTLVNTGDAPYIISKIYDETPYVASGQVVPISEWVQYMPNFQKAVKDWGMESDLQQRLQADGKYYVLPGMWEEAGGGYSLVIRKDIFEAAGVDVETLEQTWTWEDFYEACKKVKDYTGDEYVWSDVYNGACALAISGRQYGVKAGRASDGGDWNLKNGTKFDWDKMEFYFTNTSDNYKEFLAFWNKMYTDGIMDQETYSQDSETAREKFYSGQSYVMTLNYQQLADIIANGNVQDENAELYMTICPGGPYGMLQTESTRLENGLMISQKALDELGEEEFIKMLRFVDWLWYSDEGQTLSLWGVEGETYTKDESGKPVLNSDIYYNGMNQGAEKQLNADYGFGGGVFAYGGTTELRQSKMTEGEIDFNNRIHEYRDLEQLDLPIMADELQAEDLTLIQTPLMDYVNEMTLRFITGRSDLEAEWDTYVAECVSKGSQRYIDQANEIYEDTKHLFGY